MTDHNIKGVDVARFQSNTKCNYEECKRAAYYKFSASSVIGKAFKEAAKTKVKKFIWTAGKQTSEFEMVDRIPYGTGYYCSFDCARKHLLVKTFEAKVKLTPLVRDFLGQGTTNITDHETIIEDVKDIHIQNKSGPDSHDRYIKVSPNGVRGYPFLIDFSFNGYNYPIGFTLEGTKKLIASLQLLVNEQDTWEAEKVHMSRRKKT
jgi:hypothetical protein